MKEFITAVEDLEEEDSRESKIAALVATGKSEKDAREEVLAAEGSVEFKLDGRVLTAYPPTDGQLTFMLAALGRGQTNDKRFAAIINIMMASLRDEDADYLESRLLTRDPKKRLRIKQVEAIFEHLTEQWFREDVPSGSASE